MTEKHDLDLDVQLKFRIDTKISNVHFLPFPYSVLFYECICSKIDIIIMYSMKLVTS
jgi:hypothetical protein